MQTQILELSYLYKALVLSEVCWPLKAALTNVFFHAWLVTHKRDHYDDPESNNILWKIIEILVNDLEYKNSTGESEDKSIKYLGPSNVSFMYTLNQYIFNSLIPSILFTLKLNIEFSDHSALLKTIAKAACELYYKIDEPIEYKKNVYDLLSYMYNSSTFLGYLDGLKHPASNSTDEIIFTKQSKQVVLPKRVSMRRGTVMFRGVEKTKASIFHQKLVSFSKNVNVKNLLEQEFEQMVVWFSDFNERSGREFRNIDPVVSLFNILRPDNIDLSTELHVSGLKVIRKMIETANKESLEPASEWDNDDWSHCIAQVDAQQNYLVEKGAVEFLCKYISDCEIQAAIDEAILVAIALLLGGNKNTQDRFLEYMKNDENNYLLVKIKEMLIRTFDIAKRKISEKMLQLHNEQSDDDESADEIFDSVPESMQTIGNDIIMENEDVEDIEDEDDFDSITDSLESTIINCNRVLRFLQLLCENHHLELQNFLREQKSEGVTNNKSFDFVTHISNMFGTFLKGYII